MRIIQAVIVSFCVITSELLAGCSAKKGAPKAEEKKAAVRGKESTATTETEGKEPEVPGGAEVGVKGASEGEPAKPAKTRGAPIEPHTE